MHTLLFVGVLTSLSIPFIGADLVTENGTHFVFNDERTHEIHESLYQCMSEVARPKMGYGLSEDSPLVLRNRLLECDIVYWDAIQIAEEPPTFYGLSNQTDEGDMYEEFAFCAHSLSSFMWDFPENYHPAEFRKDIQDCLAYFPK